MPKALIMACKAGGGSAVRGQLCWIDAFRVVMVGTMGNDCIVYLDGGHDAILAETAESFMSRWVDVFKRHGL